MAASRGLLRYPGLFASPDVALAAQKYANDYAKSHDDPARVAVDERELRYRALLRSAVIWVAVGFPLMWAVVYVVVTTLLNVLVLGARD